MSPNPFNLIKLAIAPHKWGSRRSSSQQSQTKKEHWDQPVPGTYEYKPGRGWYLIEYAENADAASISDASTASTIKQERLPRQVTYCKVLHRMMFLTEYNERRHFETIKLSSNNDAQHVGFFRLDDGVTWVQCWDRFGNFVQGPYQRWCVDETTRRFRKMLSSDAILIGEERASRRDSWERSQKQPVTNVSARCSICSTPSVSSSRRPNFDSRASTSTVAESSRSQGTSLTTPSSGIMTKQNTLEKLDATELHAELMKLNVS